MKFNPNSLIVTATYALLLLLALETLRVRTRSVSTVDFAERIVLWTVIVLVTVATITSMIRRRRFEPLGLGAAFREIERWAERGSTRLDGDIRHRSRPEKRRHQNELHVGRRFSKSWRGVQRGDNIRSPITAVTTFN